MPSSKSVRSAPTTSSDPLLAPRVLVRAPNGVALDIWTPAGKLTGPAFLSADGHLVVGLGEGHAVAKHTPICGGRPPRNQCRSSSRR